LDRGAENIILSRGRPERGLAFSLVEAYCGPKIILDSGTVDVKSRSYIARVDCFHLLVTIVRGYGMHSTACPGSRERRPTVAGLAAVVLCSFMSAGCLHASVLDRHQLRASPVRRLSGCSVRLGNDLGCGGRVRQLARTQNSRHACGGIYEPVLRTRCAKSSLHQGPSLTLFLSPPLPPLHPGGPCM